MRRNPIIDLSECTEFRQTLDARPPLLVHGSALLLTMLTVAAVAWSAITEANLVVITSGRVRSIETPTRVFSPSRTRLEGRVAEVFFSEGDTVAMGQTLLRLDTEPLDNDIQAQQGMIQTLQRELDDIAKLEKLIDEQYDLAVAKAEAELKAATDSVDRIRIRRASERRSIEAELADAETHLSRLRKLDEYNAVSDVELASAKTNLAQLQEKRNQNQLPVDDGRIDVLRQARLMVDQEFAVKSAELQARCVAKQGALDKIAKELENLLIQRKQAVLTSPIAGVVISAEIKSGELLEPGKPVVEIARSDDYIFEATVRSQDAGDLRTGMPVQVKFDAYDYQEYGTLLGRIQFIAPDATTGSSEDSVRGSSQPGYLVRIELDQKHIGRNQKYGELKLGLGGSAEIVTDRESLLMIIVKKMRRTISLG